LGGKTTLCSGKDYIDELLRGGHRLNLFPCCLHLCEWWKGISIDCASCGHVRVMYYVQENSLLQIIVM
jgi:hypothetical protein